MKGLLDPDSLSVAVVGGMAPLEGRSHLIEAAQRAMPHGCGWYFYAVENGEGRELSEEEEDQIVNGYRLRK